jgi:hypothetical protein
MDYALEEETYNKALYIVIGILALMVMIAVMDIMTGGSLFKSLVCAMVWYLPFTGSTLTAYLNCGAIPI